MEYSIVLGFICLMLPLPALLQEKTAICVKEKFINSKMSVSRMDSFHALISHSDLFVDKSLLIKEILRLSRKTILITRPRGWGKSVNLDLLRLFFGVEVDERGVRKAANVTKHHEIFRRAGYTFHGKFEKLRKPLLITECTDIMEKYLGKYPVIYVRFDRVRGNNFRMILAQLRDVITKTFREHSYMMKVFEQFVRSNTTTNSKKYRMGKHMNLFRKFMNDEKTSLDRIQKSLQFLSKVLCEHFFKPSYLIMDGYDTPLRHMFSNESFPKEDTSKFITFYSNFLKTTFTHNTYIEKGILAGELELLNSTLFPKSKTEIGIDDEFPDFFGFTETELRAMCECAGIDDKKLARAHERYYGYAASKLSPSFVYNPWSIAHFVKSKKIRDYWINENDPREHLEAFIRFAAFREKFVSLVFRNNITMNPKNLHFTNDDFTQLQNFMRTKKREKFSWMVPNLALSFLWSHGYLTTVYDHKINHLRLRIPNMEIEEHFRIFLAIYLREELGISDKKTLLPLVEQFNKFVDDDDETADETLEQLFRNFFKIRSKRIAKGKPQLVHALLNYLVLYTDFDRRFASEGLTQDQPDVKMFNGDRGVIVEFVCDSSTTKALENARKFDKIFYKNIEIRTIKFIGMNFRSNGRVEIQAEIVDNPFLSNGTTGLYARRTRKPSTVRSSSSDESDALSTSLDDRSFDEDDVLADSSDESTAYGDESAPSYDEDNESAPSYDEGDESAASYDDDDRSAASYENDDESEASYEESGVFPASSDESATSPPPSFKRRTTRIRATSRSKPTPPLDRIHTPSRTPKSYSVRVTSTSRTLSTISSPVHVTTLQTSPTTVSSTFTTALTSTSTISSTPTPTTPPTTSISSPTTVTTPTPATTEVTGISRTRKTRVPKNDSSSVSRRTRKSRTKSTDQGNATAASETTSLPVDATSSADSSTASRSRRTRVAGNSSSVSRRTRKPKTTTAETSDSNNTSS